MWSVRRHKYRSTTPRKHGKTQEKVRFYVHLNMTWDVQRTSCNTQNKQKCRNSMEKNNWGTHIKSGKRKVQRIMWSVRRHKYRSTTPRKRGKTQEKVRFYAHPTPPRNPPKKKAKLKSTDQNEDLLWRRTRRPEGIYIHIYIYILKQLIQYIYTYICACRVGRQTHNIST